MKTDLDRARSGEHVPSLDGVRGLAILLVLLNHCFLFGGITRRVWLDRAVHGIASGGWIGVDLFFVLSGFLITGILLDSRRSATYFRSFYARRVLRIFPLYIVFLAAFLWLLPLVRTMEPEFAVLEQEQAWYWAYLVNLHIAVEGWPAYPALGHLWSLAVEEQFYLVWPFVVLACRRETLARICIGCIAFALLVRIVLVQAGETTASFVLTPTRIDALAMGGLLALRIRQPGAAESALRYGKAAVVACLLMLVATLGYYRNLSSEIPIVATLGLSVISAGGCGLIAMLLLGDGPRLVSRFFEHRALRFLGKYSYGIYVLHHPVVFFLGDSRYAATGWPRILGSELPGLLLVSVVACGLSIAAAVLSWTLLEAPILRLKRFFPYSPSSPRDDAS